MGGWLTNFDCVVCHAEGYVEWNATASEWEVKTSDTYHGGNTGGSKTIDLRDVDNRAIVTGGKGGDGGNGGNGVAVFPDTGADGGNGGLGGIGGDVMAFARSLVEMVSGLAVADALGTLLVSDAVILMRSMSICSSSATTWATFVNRPWPISVPP